MPVSSNVSHQPQMFENSSAPVKSCLRRPMIASSSKSTAETDSARRLRSWMKWHPRQGVQPSAARSIARPWKDKHTHIARCISERPGPQSSAHNPEMRSRQFQSSAFVRCGCSGIGSFPVPPPKLRLAHCASALSNGTPRALRFRSALLANTSLNRTFCCGRHLAFISFSAKSQPPQNPG